MCWQLDRLTNKWQLGSRTRISPLWTLVCLIWTLIPLTATHSASSEWGWDSDFSGMDLNRKETLGPKSKRKPPRVKPTPESYSTRAIFCCIRHKSVWLYNRKLNIIYLWRVFVSVHFSNRILKRSCHLISVLDDYLFVVRNQKRHLHLTGVGTGANKDGLFISNWYFSIPVHKSVSVY